MDDQEREDTFERWINEHRPLLHRTFRAFARPADADDLMQELQLSLWKALPAYRSESRVSTLAYRVMHNAAPSWHRGRHRRLIKTLPEPEAVPESIEGTSHQPTPLTFVRPKNYRDWLAAEHAVCGLVDLPNTGAWQAVA